ncbi:MAG: hypothetical protein RIQ89_2146, partial [Bacteroidota bacterium]
QGELQLENGLKLGSAMPIKYQAATASQKEILSFGAAPNNGLSSITCNPTVNVAPLYQFNGSIQLHGTNPAGLNVMEVGFDGANSIIESAINSTNHTDNRLLLNYYCGRDVFIGNLTSGDLTANHNLNVIGKIGIGISHPLFKLDIVGALGDNGICVSTYHSNHSYGYGVKQVCNDPHTKSFVTELNGTTNFLVYGNGTVFAREVFVKVGTLGDFVFENNYNLISIDELSKFITKHKHLPGVPSAIEVQRNDMNVGEFVNILLQKTEEQALYIIKLQEQINELYDIIKK